MKYMKGTAMEHKRVRQWRDDSSPDNTLWAFVEETLGCCISKGLQNHLSLASILVVSMIAFGKPLHDDIHLCLFCGIATCETWSLGLPCWLDTPRIGISKRPRTSLMRCRSDLVSWTVMLAAYAQTGHLEEAKNIFEEMPQRNLVSWNAMVDAYVQSGHLKEAEHMFNKMPQRDLISWNAMVSAYAQNGHLEEAENMFDEMPQRDLVSLNAMVAAYAQNGHVAEAKQMFDEMPERDMICWNAMLAAKRLDLAAPIQV